VTRAGWELIVASSVDRTLSRLPEKAAAAVGEFILGPMIEERRRVGHALHRQREGLWVARRGPYRVVYETHDQARELHVLRVDHRADVYRPR